MPNHMLHQVLDHSSTRSWITQCLVTCQSLTSSTRSWITLCMSPPYSSSRCWLRCLSPNPISINCSIGPCVCSGMESLSVIGGDHCGGGVHWFSGSVQTTLCGFQSDCVGVQLDAAGGTYYTTSTICIIPSMTLIIFC